MSYDPFNLDETEFARYCREVDFLSDDIEEAPAHPLLQVQNPGVADLSNYLRSVEVEICTERLCKDAYCHLNEGVMLRPEVVAKLAIEYLKQHPELLTD